MKIQTNMQEQDLAKTLGVEMVQNMYKVNVDDLNQLLAYHEIFGKLQNPCKLIIFFDKHTDFLLKS